MPELSVRNLRLFRGETRLEGVSLEAAPGEILALAGPAGGGAGLLLQVLAGRYRPDGGRIFCDDRDVTELPARRRGIRMLPLTPVPASAPGRSSGPWRRKAGRSCANPMPGSDCACPGRSAATPLSGRKRVSR
ncbi:ATP-binding cassette domain-containing protein [Mangrovicoccus ximenensis]|uniref:ATP-binding cassette domain-containing protein n=1 Tax=Mangrovicoccus ximenensis TaxID=1911570 RepID=UPI001374C999